MGTGDGSTRATTSLPRTTCGAPPQPSPRCRTPSTSSRPDRTPTTGPRQGAAGQPTLGPRQHDHPTACPFRPPIRASPLKDQHTRRRTRLASRVTTVVVKSSQSPDARATAIKSPLGSGASTALRCAQSRADTCARCRGAKEPGKGGSPRRTRPSHDPGFADPGRHVLATSDRRTQATGHGLAGRSSTGASAADGVREVGAYRTAASLSEAATRASRGDRGRDPLSPGRGTQLDRCGSRHRPQSARRPPALPARHGGEQEVRSGNDAPSD